MADPDWLEQEAFLRRYGHHPNPWGLTLHQWQRMIEETNEIVRRENKVN